MIFHTIYRRIGEKMGAMKKHFHPFFTRLNGKLGEKSPLSPTVFLLLKMREKGLNNVSWVAFKKA